MTYTTQEMYDCLFKAVYLKMIEQVRARPDAKVGVTRWSGIAALSLL
jgi:hypothetical protein